MKYIRSLSRLRELADIKIVKTMSDAEGVNAKIEQAETLKDEIEQEHQQGKEKLEQLIYSPISNIPDYYKLRSAIAAMNSHLLYLTTRISSLDDDIEEMNKQSNELNEELVRLRKKSKKFSKLIAERF